MNKSDLTKIVIFGSTGFVGSEIYRNLSCKNICKIECYSSFECNLLNIKEVKKTVKSFDEKTCIIFCSAIKRTIEESYETMLKNITMVHNFFSVLSHKNLRNIIFFSSVDVYGMPPENLPISEDTKINPRGYYGISKVICEEILKIELSSKCITTILRLPGLYGFNDKNQSVVGRFIKKVICCEEIVLYRGGQAKRDFLEISDLVQVVEFLIQNPKRGVLNVASGESISIKNLLSMIEEITQVKPNIKIVYEIKNNQGDLIFDTTKLKSLFPDVKFKNIRKGIEDYVTQFKILDNKKFHRR